MYLFERGDIVYIRDFPLGKPTKIMGKVVGILPNEHYNILLTNGLNEGRIVRYKCYQLIHRKEVTFESYETEDRQIIEDDNGE
jgi:hypothetical protein